MPLKPVQVKICGLTCAEDARMVAGLGADWVGINFHPASPRFVTPERAREIVHALPNSCKPIGVFVDLSTEEVRKIALACGLFAVQLHGDEAPAYVEQLAGMRVIKAIRVGTPADLVTVSDFARECEERKASPYAYLFDAYDPERHGGTGRRIHNDLIPELNDLAGSLGRVILAGGLSPENVAESLRNFRPWMVDVASGVESSPGRKDRLLVSRFIAAVRAPI